LSLSVVGDRLSAIRPMQPGPRIDDDARPCKPPDVDNG
jgi:hypothetical protein